jgi:hypothetical protein
MAALIPSASATGSGTMTLAGPSTNSNQTITIPDATGTMMVSGNMPAFSAYGNPATTIANATYVKVQFQTKEYDTNSCFDATTNYRFTPNVAGYYLITGAVGCANNSEKQLVIYKNGSRFKDGNDFTGYISSVQSVVYCNGSTDYIELYFIQYSGSSQTTYTGSFNCVFQGTMVRSA